MMDTYINENCFQFLVDFTDYEIDVNGEKRKIKFSELTLEERVFLSAYLTILSIKEDICRNNIYMTIFDFNREKKHGKKYTALDYCFCDDFMNEFTKFLKEKPEFFSFIKDNFNKIVDNKTLLYRTQINRDEYSALNKLKVSNNYRKFLACLYIIGVAKNKCNTYSLNKVNLDYFCFSNLSIAKNTAKTFFKALGFDDSDYKIISKENIIYFKSKWKRELSNRYFTEEKKKFSSLDDFFNEDKKKKKIEDKPKVIVEEEKPIKTVKKIEEKPVIETEIDEEAERALKLDKEAEEKKDKEPVRNEFDIALKNENMLNLIESRLNRKMIVEYNKKHPDSFNDVIDKKYRKEYLKFNSAILKIMDNKDIASVILGQRINGEDWQNRKNTALCEIYNCQNKIFCCLDKLYNRDKVCYIEVMKRLRFHKLLTFDTGIKE